MRLLQLGAAAAADGPSADANAPDSAEALGDHMQLYARADQQFAIREGGDHLARDLRRSIVGAREGP